MLSAEGATAPETLRQKDRLDARNSGEQWPCFFYQGHSPKEKAEAYLSENSQVTDRGGKSNKSWILHICQEI
jgi:hypothetical protein